MEYQNQYQNNYQQNTSADGYELGWEDEIQQEDSYVLLPESDYLFTVQKVERSRYTPKQNSKIPACNMAIVTFSVGNATLTENFMLHSKMEWKLSALYAAIGMKQKGEKVRMDWPGVVGRSGFCHVGLREYTKNDGSKGQSNELSKFYAPWDKEYSQLQQRFGSVQQPAPQAAYQQPVQQQTAMPGYQTNASAWQPGKF